jgi:hypothetical protein
VNNKKRENIAIIIVVVVVVIFAFPFPRTLDIMGP